MKHEPLEVFARHATGLLSRLAAFEKVRRQRGCALISVRHATPEGEDVAVGTFEEVAAMLRASKFHDLAHELESRSGGDTHVVAIIHDLHYPPTLVEVPP